MTPRLYSKAVRLCQCVWLAGMAWLASAQALPNAPNIIKYTDINVGSLAKPFPGALALNSSLGTRNAKGVPSLGRFTLTGTKGNGWSIANGSAIPFPLTGSKGGTVQVTSVTFGPGTPLTGIFPASGTTGEFSVGVTLSAGTGPTPAGTYTGAVALNVTDTTMGRTSATRFIVRADFLTAISLSQNTDLRFGDVIKSATAGTVMLTPTGVRTQTGGVTLGFMTPSGPATFTVTGDPNVTYAITLPSSITINGPGGATLTVSSVTSAPNATGLLDGSGQQTLAVAGTLNVAGNQQDGAYTGTFNVTVAYN